MELFMVMRGIGDILIELGVVTRQQLLECQKEVKDNNKKVEECLLQKKIITPVDLARAYASYASVDFIENITDTMAESSLLGKVTLKFLRDNEVVPVMIDGSLVILTSNPLLFQPIDELRLLLGGTGAYAVATRSAILEAINRYYPLEGAKQMLEELEQEEANDLEAVEFTDIEEKDIIAMAAEAPIVKLVNHILFQAVKQGASDIHIEPYEKEVVVRYRIDGILYPIMRPPKRLQGALISRIKIMAHLNIAEKRLPQDGRIDIRVTGRAIDIRVSILPTAFGERVVMRLLDKGRSFSVLKNLDFSKRDYDLLMRSITRPNGILYMTGPTGSGKTSTLYSILSELNRPEVNIVTVEDPVEYQMLGISQVQVKEAIGMSFAAALRSILRQDPDIIMIGETRDQETAQIAIQSALTGHLVLSTLHTNSAPATVTRLLDMGIEPFLIASSVHLAMAQRLIRKLCSECKKLYKPSKSVLTSIGITEKEAAKITFYQEKGCSECNSTGYKGRVAIFELMEVTDAVAQLIMIRANTAQINKQAIADGMTTLLQDGIRKIEQGITTIAEVLSVATIEHGVIKE